MLERSSPPPQFTAADRVFWVLLLRWWEHWRRPLRLVRPQTVIAWHRRIWRFWWWRKSRPGYGGRPRLNRELIELIKRISRENPTWGALSPKTENPAPPARTEQPLARTAHKRKTRKLSPPGHIVNRNACLIPQKKAWLPGLDEEAEEFSDFAVTIA